MATVSNDEEIDDQFIFDIDLILDNDQEYQQWLDEKSKQNIEFMEQNAFFQEEK